MEFNIKGDEEFIRAIERNPQVAKEEVGKFLVRATRRYKATINNNPWRVGMTGGGVPVKTHNLMQGHRTEINNWNARIYVLDNVEYRWKVHEGQGNMKARPWLDYAMSYNEKEVDRLGSEMLQAIVNNLAK